MEIKDDVGGAIADWGLRPIHEAGIWTHHMTRGWFPRGSKGQLVEITGERAELIPGPLTLTLAARLVFPGDIKRALALGPAIELSLGYGLNIPDGVPFPVRVYQGTRHLMIEIPRPDPYHPTLDELGELGADEIMIGLDSQMLVARVNLAATAPGALFVGMTGSGKSTAMRLVAASAIRQGWKLRALIDLKNDDDYREFAPFASLAAFDPATANKALDVLLVEMAERMAGRIEKTPTIVLIDELAQLDQRGKDKLARLASQCRSANIRLLLGTQRAGKELPRFLTSQLATRIVGQVHATGDSFDATGVPDAGAELLTGAGDMLLVTGSTVRRVSIANVTRADVPALLMSVPRAGQPLAEVGTPVQIGRDGYVRETMARWEAAAASRPQMRVPPRWLLEKALRYVERHKTTPSYGLMRTWQEQRGEAVLSDARRRDVIEAAEEWRGRFV